MTSHRFIIKPNGTFRYLDPPPFPVPGPKLRKRFSHIRPVNPALRVVFLLLRWAFGEKGRASEFTRRWNFCEWECLIIHSGERKRSRSRQELLDWERERFFEPLGDLL